MTGVHLIGSSRVRVGGSTKYESDFYLKFFDEVTTQKFSFPISSPLNVEFERTLIYKGR